MSEYRILVLGGYGNFGSQISRRLAADPKNAVLVGGRDPAAAENLAATLPGNRHRGVALDITSTTLSSCLRDLAADLVIHTSGPFQRQDYSVARACIEAGSDYIDLADGRGFVEGFTTLDNEARETGRALVTGASTVPGVSAAVVRAHEAEFMQIEAVRIGITPGQQTPRGRATLAAVLSYCGQPFTRREHGSWRIRHGWQDLRRFPHPALGQRLWGACDVPDLALFPRRWPSLRTVTFHAGLELSLLQFGLWLGAWSVRARLIRDLSRHAARLLHAATFFDRFGTSDGGMFVTLEGIDIAGDPMTVEWWLTARNGDGPFIPCVPAVVLARRLANGHRPESGAFPCLDLLSLGEFAREVSDRDIEWTISRRAT